jgi:hypothetical protein
MQFDTSYPTIPEAHRGNTTAKRLRLHSPGLPRFAATLGRESKREDNPKRGCDGISSTSLFLQGRR